MAANNRQQVERLMSGLNAGNSSIIEEIYHPDAEIDWPQFGERIYGAADRRKVFDSLPTKPNVHMRRVFGEGDIWVMEALLVYGNEESHGIWILEFRSGKVVRETSYWAEPKPGGAGWKKRWVHPLEAIARIPEPDELELQ